MNKPIKYLLSTTTGLFLLIGSTNAFSDTHDPVSDRTVATQRHMLETNTKDLGFGPQAPRDIDSLAGNNDRAFGASPASTKMNLCNIHFHKHAEHKGGEFTKYVGNGNGLGYDTGYEYSGELSAAELTKIDKEIGSSEHGFLAPGDTIEVHYVYTTALVQPGPTLGSCLSKAINNPQLRVETQVYVLVNDANASSFVELTKHEIKDGLHQAINIPMNTGAPVQYEGSTTGPGFNEQGSPFQVSWSVRPKVVKIDIETVDAWLKDNVFDEKHAQGVRNLVINPALLSDIN